MGFKLVALSSWLLTVSALSIEHNAVGGGCIDLLCPDTASHHGLRNLVNEDTLKTDACTACSQCTENGYSVCLRPKDSRASRTAGGCSCSHTLAANCHTDLTQTQHPANLTMKLYTACYADALQRPPQPLAVNENSSVVVTIEPFWLEPYWRHLKVENVTLHYKFQVKAPEHCEGEVESTPNGVHTCVASVLVDLSESKEDQPQGAKDDDDDYDHSDNYDQYDDDLPPEVQFDRDVFTGAKELESYYTATIRRSRQIKASASKDQQIHDGETIIESEHLKFDLKPELYENGETESAAESSNDAVPEATTKEESATVVQEDKDEGDVSDETGGTNFFEEEEKKEEETKKEDESEEEDGVLKVNLEDIEPIKLKSQEDAKKKADEDGDDEEKEETETTSEKPDEKSGETEDKKDEEEKKEDEKKDDDEEKKDEEEEETTEEGTTFAGEESEESNEEDSDETTTVELVEGETDPSQQNFWQRFVNSPDFPRVRNVFMACIGGFIIVCSIGLCCVYGKRCCKSKESKTSNGYRYTSANPPPPTELKTVSRAPSGAVPEDETRLLAEGEAMENFKSVVNSGTPIQPNKVEIGITVGMGKFGPIHRAMFNSYNGSVHDVNVYLLKNVARLSDEELVKLTSLLKSNISAGAHPNVVSLCGISPVGTDVMLMWEPLHQSVLRGVLRESRCARFGTEPFNMASFLSSERLAAIAIGCCNGVEHLLKRNVFPTHLSTSNVLLAERGIVKIGGFGLAEHHALDTTTERAPTKLRWMPPEYFKRDQKMIQNEQTLIWSLGVTLWEIFSLGGTPFSSIRQAQTFIDAMRDGSAQLDPITYCGEAVTQLLSTCTSHIQEARGDIRTIIKRLECISADAKTQINLCYREDFPYLPIVTPLEQQQEE